MSSSPEGSFPIFERVDKTSAYEAVRAQLVASIEAESLAVGEKLPSEAKLADAFGVSRPVVREALGSLKALGLVRSVSGSGTFVAARKPFLNLGGYTVLELDFVRRSLEIPAAAEAARLCSEEDATELTTTVAAFSKCRHADAWSRLDGAFHLVIARTTRNHLLVDLTEYMKDAINQLSSSLMSESRRAQADIEHRRICEAIIARDPRAAAEAMGNHLSAVRESILAMSGEDAARFGDNSENGPSSHNGIMAEVVNT